MLDFLNGQSAPAKVEETTASKSPRRTVTLSSLKGLSSLVGGESAEAPKGKKAKKAPEETTPVEEPATEAPAEEPEETVDFETLIPAALASLKTIFDDVRPTKKVVAKLVQETAEASKRASLAAAGEVLGAFAVSSLRKARPRDLNIVAHSVGIILTEAVSKITKK